MRPGNEGFTGLEAAIVLMAFIVIASVFSYVVLGAGFFSIQKSQQTIYTAVETSSSPVTIENQVFGCKNESSGKIGSLIVTIGKRYGSGSVLDLSKISVIWSDKENLFMIDRSDPIYTDMPSSGSWGIVDKQGESVETGYLENGEYATMLINMSPEYEISGRESFSFELISPDGTVAFSSISPLTIDRITTLYPKN
ncbi:MAG: hypothetical protein JW931_08130 [Methanomicrobiaceae archaeon]|nr:hypothetical protein [Methanomicrobiaceae archaeon]